MGAASASATTASPRRSPSAGRTPSSPTRRGIQSYYEREFGVPSELIAYGAPSIFPRDLDLLATLNLQPRRYHLVVARFEPENHVDIIVKGYCASAATDPLIVVGSAPYADEYMASVEARGRRSGAVRRLGLGPEPPRRALRQRADLPARPLGRRHEPLAAAGHRRRRADRSRSTCRSTATSSAMPAATGRAPPRWPRSSSPPRPTATRRCAAATAPGPGPPPTSGTTSPRTTRSSADGWRLANNVDPVHPGGAPNPRPKRSRPEMTTTSSETTRPDRTR